MYALVILLMLVLSPAVSLAQSVTWHQLDIRDTDRPLLALFIRGLAPDGHLLGNGRLTDFLVAPDHTTLTPILCPNIAQDPTEIRRGPDIHALNALLTVVGDLRVVQGAQPSSLAGILQPQGGTGDCTLVQRPGAVNTSLRAANDAGKSAGVSQGPDPSQGLRRFEGFTRDPDGTFTPLTGVCNTDAEGNVTAEVLHPEAMSGDWLVGYGYCNVQPTNAYRYEAFVCQDGVGCQTLRDPDGKTLWLPAVTQDGLAYGSQATSEFVPNGKAWKIALATTTFTELPLPPPVTPGATVLACHPTAAGPQGWVCTSREQKANCPPPETPTASCLVSAQWLALYDTPPPAVEPTGAPEDPRKQDRGPRNKPGKEKEEGEKPRRAR